MFLFQNNFLSLLFKWGLLLGLSSCSDPEITDDYLDGEVIFDPSLYAPEEYLVSEKYPSPTQSDLDKHVLIAIHGYSATTFEWQEFQDWSGDTGTYRVSQVLLDGHGRTYEAFKASKWEDWSNAIKREYEALEALGYTKISLVGSSTGGALILELIASGYFENKTAPKNLFLVDAIALPSIKIQSIAGIIGPMLVYVESDLEEGEENFWYKFRPHETVSELNELMKVNRKALEDGFVCPPGTELKVYHSKHDPTASSTSAVLIFQGVKESDGSPIEVEIIDSDIHVFTRLDLRSNVTQKQRTNQLAAFQDIANRLK